MVSCRFAGAAAAAAKAFLSICLFLVSLLRFAAASSISRISCTTHSTLPIVRPAPTDTPHSPLDMQEMLPDARGTPDKFICTVLALHFGLFPLMLSYRDMLPFCPLTLDYNESIYIKTAFLKSWGVGGGSKGPFANIAHRTCLKFGSLANFTEHMQILFL